LRGADNARLVQRVGLGGVGSLTGSCEGLNTGYALGILSNVSTTSVPIYPRRVLLVDTGLFL